MTRKEQTQDSRPKTQDKKKETEPRMLMSGTDEQVTEPEVTEPEMPKAPKQRKKSARYHFPNALQCPRCRSYDTVATSTKVNKQYRTCRRGHCRHRYCVTGVKEKKSR